MDSINTKTSQIFKNTSRDIPTDNELIQPMSQLYPTACFGYRKNYQMQRFPLLYQWLHVAQKDL